ncbi:hypothetical protein M5K25_000432 [Dendrobium thyrsiflorum]|uniref:Uncharacterized protein n=1 Tax=Dendrobium thyrsiflorum TaxID=117978 RepID=A0ABD0W4U3_DENTH
MEVWEVEFRSKKKYYSPQPHFNKGGHLIEAIVRPRFWLSVNYRIQTPNSAENSDIRAAEGVDYLIGDDGLAKQKLHKHWKGNNGLYCAGLVRRGLYGSAEDAINIANDISNVLKSVKKTIA